MDKKMISGRLGKMLTKELSDADNKIDFIESIKEFLHSVSPLKEQPVNLVRWVDIDKVQANDYNPNTVAKIEMKLLHTSISHDGYTQPVVTIYDKDKDKSLAI